MCAMPTVRLKPGKERSLARRHPWIYASAIDRVSGSPGNGALVQVRGEDGRFWAWAAYSPSSTIRARCWSFEPSERIDADWLAARVTTAVARRRQLHEVTSAVRLVFGEADGLPGLIVDRYGEYLVTQFQSAGIDAHREVVLDALCRACACENVFDRSDPALREREALAALGGVLRGAPPPKHVGIREYDVRYWVDVRHGHKTGFYIDQRDNRRLAGEIVQRLCARHGRAPRVLNCFCYTGGFSIAAARAGAATVTSVDSSADALELAHANAQLNALASDGDSSSPSAVHLDWLCADAFEQLRILRAEERRYDLIVLDPPKFATNQHQVPRAARAYKDINLSALRLLEPGGMLLTFSCSAAVGADLFQKIVAGAAVDAQADCYLRARLAAAADHPTLLAHPEGEYLKGLWLERA